MDGKNGRINRSDRVPAPFVRGTSDSSVACPQEAFDAAKRQPKIDLFVSDVGLKGDKMSGTNVAVALAGKQEKLPVVLVSGMPLATVLDGR